VREPLKRSEDGSSAGWGCLLSATWIVSIMAGVAQIAVHRSEGQDWAGSDVALILWFACLIAVTACWIVSAVHHRRDSKRNGRPSLM